MQKNNLLLVTGTWGPHGGIEQVNLDIVRAFESMGWTVNVLADQYRSFDHTLTDSVRFHVLVPKLPHLLGRIFRKFLLNAYRKFRFKQLAARSDLVVFTHIHDLNKLRDVLSGTRVWLWAHGIEIWGENTKKLAGLEHLIEKIICVSRYTLGHVASVFPPEKCKVVYNAVDTSFFKPSPNPDEAFQSDILIVGRIAKGRPKGHDVIIEIINELEASLCRPLTVAISGEGDDLQRIRDKTQDLKCSTSVKYLGRLSNEELVKAYAATKVFCMLSPTGISADGNWFGEGFGIVSIEAQACGTAVLVSSQGGSPETIAASKTGIAVDPNDKDAVVKALMFLLSNEAQRKAMGSAARENVVQNFSYSCFGQNLSKLLPPARLGPTPLRES